MSGGYDCECAVRSPKPNGTCANCGHWLPGEREKGPNLAAVWSGGKTDADQFAKCATCKHNRIDHIIDGACLAKGCACFGFADNPNPKEPNE